jgi:hypothetical protein
MRPPPQPVSLQDIRRLLYEPIRRISMRDWVSTLNSLSSRKKRRMLPLPPPAAAEPPYEVPEWIAEILYQTSAHYLPTHQPKFTFSTGAHEAEAEPVGFRWGSLRSLNATQTSRSGCVDPASRGLSLGYNKRHQILFRNNRKIKT